MPFVSKGQIISIALNPDRPFSSRFHFIEKDVFLKLTKRSQDSR